MRYVWLISLLILLAGCSEPPKVSEHAIHYQNAKGLAPFSLRDQHGKQRTNADLKEQWTLIFLGYTSCPDICPMTLAKLTQIHDSLKTHHKIKVWFISVDPNRDIDSKRKAYIEYFNSDFSALTAPHKVLFPFVRDVGLIYAINDSDKPEYYVDHSASVALVNPKGELAGIFKAKFTANEVPLIDSVQLIEDFKVIAD